MVHNRYDTCFDLCMKFKLMVAWLFPTFLALTMQAASIEGDVKLNFSASGFEENVFKKEFGQVVKATTKWYVGDFFGKETVFGGITVKNSGTKPMFYQYFVSFFDKDKKLVGAAAQGSFGKDGLKPGEETQLGSCLASLPKGKYKE